MSADSLPKLGKQKQYGGYEKSYAAKKVKPAIPTWFPNPHKYQEKVRHPWEHTFEEYSTEIRSKPKWYEKVNDEEILAKWQTEIKDPWMWERLKDELQYLASLKTPECEPSPVDRVWMKSDGIPEEIHKKFVDLVATRLETKEKEFHPHSNETVVDLVHPSLYCYVHGKTKLLQEPNHSQLTSREEWKKFLQSGQSATNPTLQESLDVIKKANGSNEYAETDDSSSEGDNSTQESDNETSKIKFDARLLFSEYQTLNQYDYNLEAEKLNQAKENLSNHLAGIYRWIPADIQVDMFGKVSFLSYINGIHPFEDQELYSAIAEIMNYFLPLWGNVLLDISRDPPAHAEDRIDTTDYEAAYGIADYEITGRYRDSIKKGKEKFGDSFDESRWLRSNPLLLEFRTPERPPPIDFSRAQLKVIVKIASIELTPENPTYTGNWHIEGVPEEAIISTGIYYFAEENIADSFLRFRLGHGDPDITSVQCPMGLGFGSSMNRNAGKVQTKQGLLLAFPNIMQHCLRQVTLKDETKPGYRKILVFFLVDPNKEVASGGTVPPPSEEWATKEALKTDESHQSLDKARENRENLMFTRKYYVLSQNDLIFERECTFCEH